MSDADGLGTIATGALIAHEIERAHAGRPAVGHRDDEPCANCGTERVGAFCHACGQAGHVHRNLGTLVHDIAHGVFHFEGKVWHTLPLLAWHPGALTRRYVQGERARFVSPIALFLFSVFLMFAVVSSLAGHGGAGEGLNAQIGRGLELSQARTQLATLEAQRAAASAGAGRQQLDRAIARQAAAVNRLSRGPHSASAEARSTDGDHGAVAPPTVRTGWTWLDTPINHAARNPELLLYKMKTYGYKYSWALIPISLPFIWLLFALRRDVGLYDHAIFSIYSLSFMSLAVVALSVAGKIGVPTTLIVLAVLIVPPVHMYRQLKGAYRLGRFGAAWRTCALLIITTITSALFLAFLIYMGTD